MTAISKNSRRFFAAHQASLQQKVLKIGSDNRLLLLKAEQLFCGAIDCSFIDKVGILVLGFSANG
ncbi:hypothetical protein EVA_11295 [gut metagenome]|uniref:Uncharacterized protein n=1 Tax=gut metagenome TaxID=749906 RepID=J9GLI1_9ZZZZ